MSGDDLDSFFAEINQIAPADDAPVAAKPEIVVQTAAVSKPQVISKPAELGNRSVVVAEHTAVASHPVYTYTQPEFMANVNFKAYDQPPQPEPQFYQNVSVADSRPPPPATVAPPQVPRQNKVRISTANPFHSVITWHCLHAVDRPL